jgi:hypothetical protein
LCGALVLITSLVLTVRTRRLAPVERRVRVPFGSPEVAT